MKKPKQTNRYCKHCKSHTEHKIKEAKRKGVGSAHPLTHSSKKRVRARGSWRGQGNQGRYSRPPINARKMSGKKTSKSTDFRYSCTKCSKVSMQKYGIRAKRVEYV